MAEVRLYSTPDVGALLHRLGRTGLNFDPADLEEAAPERGWLVDRYRQELATEPQGDPLPDGPWSIACELSATYSFVEPSLVRSFFDRKEPLERRTLLLEVHFWGLRIYAGVRVGAVYDVIRAQGRVRERVRGWCYDTLEGHFEQGRICYEVSKGLDTGRVEFRIDALSRRADPDNLLVTAGFIIFGRRKQREFARTACERMAELTRARLKGQDVTSTGAVDEHVALRPDAADAAKERGP
jgi:hypothetical protein